MSIRLTSDTQFIGGIPRLHVMFFGPGGVGKTTLAYSFNDDPRTGPVLGINMAGNPEAVLSGPNPPVIIGLEKLNDLDEVLDFLRAGQPVEHRVRTKFDIPSNVVFKTLVFDMFSDWQRALIERTTGNDAIKIISQAVAPEALAHGGKIFATTMKALRDLLTSLPVHVILVNQQQEVVDFTGVKPPQKRPFLYGQARDQAAHYLNLQGMMERISVGGRSEVVIHWDLPTIEGQTKDQVSRGKLGRSTRNPSATTILNLIAEGRPTT